MKNQTYKKILACALATLITTTGTPFLTLIHAEETGWKQDSTGWYYQNSDGTYQKNGWFQTKDNHWYYFDQSGYMQTGWIRYNNSWYYTDESGKMQTEDITINGIPYHFDKNGVWTKKTASTSQNKNTAIQFKTSALENLIKSQRKSETTSAITQSELENYTTIKFIFLTDASEEIILQLETNSATPIGSISFSSENIEEIAADLSLFPNLEKIILTPIYLEYDSSLTKEFFYDDILTTMRDLLYALFDNGFSSDLLILLTGNMNVDLFWLSGFPSRDIGWQQDNTGWRYQNSDGTYQKNGWFQDKDNNWYYFNQSGYMQTGWISDNDSLYFTDKSGKMQTGDITINGTIYHFANNGALTGEKPFIETKKENAIRFKTDGLETLIKNNRQNGADHCVTTNDLADYTTAAFDFSSDNKKEIQLYFECNNSNCSIETIPISPENLEDIVTDLSLFPNLNQIKINISFGFHLSDEEFINKDTIVAFDNLILALENNYHFPELKILAKYYIQMELYLPH